MSTDSTPKTGRASRGSILTADQGSPVSPSPVGSTRKSRGRPSLGEISTISSASSKLSETFDTIKPTSLCPESPTTPTCETPPQHEKLPAPEVRKFARNLDNLSHSEPKPRQKRALEESPPRSPKLVDTPSRGTRERRNAEKSRFSIDQKPEFRTHLAPTNNTTRQRASSAPDLEHWRELPGKFESQSTSNDADIVVPSTKLEHHPEKDEVEQSTEPAVYADDFMIDTESRCSDEENSFLLEGKSQLPETELLQTPAPPALPSEPLPPAFTPFTSETRNPKLRKFNKRRSIDSRIRALIQKNQGKPESPGYVYVLETKDYGPNILKIGRTKHFPDRRVIRLKRDCGLQVDEVLDETQNPFYYFELVESLVHLELDDERLKLKCEFPKCTTIHQEWFKIHQKKALATVHKWRRWVIKNPFDESGQLTPYWAERAKSLETSPDGVKWEEWLSPPIYDRFVFTLRRYWSRFVSELKAHFARSRKDDCFWYAGMIITFLSYFVHGEKGAFWTVVALLIL
jgi:hypothetical protein